MDAARARGTPLHQGLDADRRRARGHHAADAGRVRAGAGRRHPHDGRHAVRGVPRARPRYHGDGPERLRQHLVVDRHLQGPGQYRRLAAAAAVTAATNAVAAAEASEDYADYNAFSIYLNREWDSNWGGWFAYTEEYNWQEGDINPKRGQFVVPKYNLSIMSTEKEWHCTTPISPYAQPRLSIQLFFSKNT